VQEELDLEEDQRIQTDTQRYLDHIEKKIYQDIQTRKRIDAGLLFLACQISSCTLAWLLFQLQITLAIIQVSSVCVALLPGLIDVGDGFNFSVSSERWEIDFGQKPLTGVIKLIIGGAVSLSGSAQITAQIVQTQAGIAQTYREIRSNDGLNWQLPNIGLPLLISLLAIFMIGILRKAYSKEEIKDAN